MSNKQSNNKAKSNQYPAGGGSQYHREHAGNVQGYGSNNVDVNENGLTNVTDNSNQ